MSANSMIPYRVRAGASFDVYTTPLAPAVVALYLTGQITGSLWKHFLSFEATGLVLIGDGSAIP